MTKIDIISGFLGAGKTTLIKKLIKEAFCGEKLVIIENEFGDIGIDGGFLKESGIQITEMNSGCICCSLVGDFGKALAEVLEKYSPDRIIIEPSGVGKLSDVIAAVQRLDVEDAKLNSFSTVVDAKKCKMYMKNFGEFFNNQVESAGTVILSHVGGLDEAKLDAVVDMLREHNAESEIITTDWDQLSGKQILDSIEHSKTLESELAALMEETHHHHHHDDDDDDDECCCHHHHHHDDDDDDDECCHHHHHHDDDDDEECCHHHHHHDDDDDDHECCHHHHHHDDDDDDDHECCHHHDGEGHHHHHHHHADEVFTSWGQETAKKFTKEDIENALAALQNEEKYGIILRAKGIVDGGDVWYHFDYTPGEADVRTGAADTTGRLCVIGSKINEDAIAALFN